LETLKVQEPKMVKRRVFMGMFCLALAFGFLAAACDNGNDNSPADPILVDLSLPLVRDIAPFAGTFVSGENEAKELVAFALEEISALPKPASLIGAVRAVPGTARSAVSDSYETIYDHNESVFPGAETTGFIQGKNTSFAADDKNYNRTVGDYYEMSTRIKMEVDFKDTIKHGIDIKGKYTVNNTRYSKMQVASLNPPGMTFVIKLGVAEAYALSVSKNGKGLKFITTIEAGADETFDLTEETGTGESSDWYDPYNFSIKIYDNGDVLKYEKIFNSPEDVEEYLGFYPY
jgi:hypothetical protein